MIVHFHVKNSNGEVVRTGSCAKADFERQAGAGETVHEGSAAIAQEPMVNPDDYRNQRFVAYPSLRDQLDALWHAMNSGALPKAEPFFSSIKSVKDRFPKA